MSHFNIAITGLYDIRLPSWGRCFWQSPTDGELFLAFASGTTEVYYITSNDLGVSWSNPTLLFPVDDFSTHGNFDIFMDPRDHIHCAFRYNGSGCYKFMGKVPGGGWSEASGAGIVGFVDVADTGSVKGFQGSITVTEKDFGSDVDTVYPLVRIAAKNSSNDVNTYYMGYPYNSGYLAEDIVGGPNAGPNGGFPIIFNDAENEAPGLTYYNDIDRKLECYNRGFGWFESFEGSIPLQSGDIYPNERLAFGSGVMKFSDGMMFVTSSSGHDIYGNTIDLFFPVWKSLEELEESGVWPWKNNIPRSGIYGISAGTLCDFSFDDNGSTHLYYMAQDETGRYSICRVLQTTVYKNFGYNYYHSDQHPSGLKYVATASVTTTGGKMNRVVWDNFKAVRHPLSPGDTRNGVSKGEFIVTQGYTSSYPSGGILTVWNLEDAPGTKRFQQPYFRMDYTATSGSGPFVGIKEVFFSSNSNNMFDQDPTTYGLFANGSYVYLEFDRVLEIDKIDVQGTRTEDIGQIDVYASFDDVVYTHVGTIPSGNPLFNFLRRLTSDQDALTDESFDLSYKWDPISAKYIRLNWTTTYGNSGRRIGEIRVFGPAATSGGIFTYGTTYRHDGPVQSPFTERFVHHEGSLPPRWRTYGDYPWGIVASGDFTKTSSLPTASQNPGYDGLIPSGRFAGVSRGSGDGFSVRNTPNAPYGTSGVLEIDIEVTNDENIAGGKVISFDYQLDEHPDDVFGVYLDDGTIILEATGIRRGWTSHSHTITGGAGNYTVRFVYTRGNSDIAGSIGAVWVDNFVGSIGPVINSINGLVKSDYPVGTGTIYGYLNTNMSEAIHGYVSGAPLDSSIHGYLSSATSPDVTSSVFGFLSGKGQWINGFVLATSGYDALTYPTGAIHGFVKVLNSGAISSINGYVDGRNDHVIHGYTLGGIDVPETGTIHGYVAGNNANSYIYGLVNGSGEHYTTTSIHGYVDSRYGQGDQVIHGYVSVESGLLSSINGYAIGWNGTSAFSHGPQSMIWGYLVGPPSGTSIHGYVRSILPFSSIHGYLGSEALVASGGGLVGETSTSNVVAGTNLINGYVKGFDGSQQIHGYVLGPLGGTSSVHGYVLAGVEDNRIHGYLVGVQLPTTTIHGFTSGVYWSESQVHGWIAGVSGIDASSIHGMAIGAQPVNSIINAKLIGTLARNNNQAACISHNFPLASVPIITGIPSVFMNTGV